MLVRATLLLVSWVLTPQLVQAQFQLFPDGTHSTENLSQGCVTALNATIMCDPYIQQIVSDDYYGSLNNATLQNSVCAVSCGTSLKSYHNGVTSACANDPQPWDGVPAIWAGDVIWANYNRTCLKDPSTGAYCVDQIAAISTGDVDQDVFSLPQAQLCSPCMLALLENVQSTPYSNYDDSYVQAWLQVQATCNTGPLPTAVQPPATNMTALPGVVIANPAGTTCLSGNHYIVQSGDDIQAIAVAHNVPTGPLKTLNGVFPDGTNLFAGQDLCLPRTCTVYLVQANDNCATVAAAHGITFPQLVSYNPSINLDCTNLISNTNICVGPSGATYTPTTIPGATSTTSSFATSTVAPPGATPFGTTVNCGKFYQVNPGDNCQQISLNNSIALDLFEETNPSINTDCTNLTPGLFYCVWPLQDWNATAITTTTSTFATPPAPTPTGSTANCFQWHVIASGDTCSLLSASFGASMAQLQAWNPQINDQCTNLLLGEAYCVNAPAASSTTSTPTATPTGPVTPPGPTQTGIPSNCDKYVLQQTGLFCQDMANAAGITLDQLYSWNPALNGDCSGLFVGFAYCIGVSGPVSSTPTPTPTPTPTVTPTPTPTAPVTPPGPTQAGIASNCNKYVLQQDGVFCFDMANNAGITLDQLYAWNPALNGDCTGLFVGFAYCIGVSAPTANRRRHHLRAIDHDAVLY